MVGEVATISSLGVQVSRIPTIAAHEGGGDALFLGLVGDQVDDIVVIGQVDDIGFGIGNLGQDGAEIGILGGVGFLANDRAAQFGEVLLRRPRPGRSRSHWPDRP